MLAADSDNNKELTCFIPLFCFLICCFPLFIFECWKAWLLLLLLFCCVANLQAQVSWLCFYFVELAWILLPNTYCYSRMLLRLLNCPVKLDLNLTWSPITNSVKRNRRETLGSLIFLTLMRFCLVHVCPIFHVSKFCCCSVIVLTLAETLLNLTSPQWP